MVTEVRRVSVLFAYFFRLLRASHLAWRPSDMAVANAIGSNVFNIFLGIGAMPESLHTFGSNGTATVIRIAVLGLPMLISPFIWNEPFVVPDGLAVFTTTLMLIVITFIMVRFLCRA
jgi:Ca2+/Na+ antiporter